MIAAENFPDTKAETLGEVAGFPIVLIRHRHQKPSKLIVAGFHGDEPAGFLALLNLVKKHRMPRSVALIPMVNPTGWNLGTRENFLGQDPNRGYVHRMDNPSLEGQILLQHMPRLLDYASEGLLSLHEDRDMSTHFYLCSNGGFDFTRRIYDSLDGFFLPSSDSSLDEGHPNHGITKIVCDGSFEDYYLEQGVIPVVHIETPAKDPLETRVRAQMAVCEAFLGLEDTGGTYRKKAIQSLVGEGKAWGLCTAVDLHDCNPALIRNANHIRRYAAKLCTLINMKPIGECRIARFGKGRLLGYSMSQFVSTSLISGHFAEEDNSAFLDIFSCKGYDPIAVESFSRDFFGARHSEARVTLRR